MYEQPRLISGPDGFQIHVAEAEAVELLADLKGQGFQAEIADGDFGAEDLNADAGQEVIRIIELPASVDKLKLRQFLRVRGK